jgi:hypothetical protein
MTTPIAGLPVAGYKSQSQDKIDLVNQNKQLEERVLRQLDTLQSTAGLDYGWVSIARTHIQEGFMAANRAVFQPERIALPEDIILGNVSDEDLAAMAKDADPSVIIGFTEQPLA